MDHDLDTLHGIASAPSDSGYASTQYSAQHPGASDAPRHPGPASLNSRLDRLTRQMSSLANSSPYDAGASIGITRKTIARTVYSASEASTRASRARRRRVEEQEDDEAHEQPPAKRRRSLPPRLTLRKSSTGEGAAGGDVASGYSAQVLLERVVSPRSGATRIVTSSTAQPSFVETLEGTMQIPSFLREQQDSPQLPASPPPDWLSSRLLARSRAHDRAPARAPSRAPFSSTPNHLDSFPLDHALSEHHTGYEPAFDRLSRAPSPRASASNWVALPFSTDGRLARTASLASSPPPRPRPPDSLYEAQMHRDYHFLDSTPPSQQQQHRRSPAVAPPFSQPHRLALPPDSLHDEQPAEPRTIFGQPIDDLAHFYDVARPSTRRYVPSSSPPPYPTAHGPLSPPLSPAPSELDTLLDELDAPMSSVDFWRPRPRAPVLLAPSPTPGRARYAALLKRSAAQQVRPVEDAPSLPQLVGPEHEHEHERGVSDGGAMQLEKQHHATPSGSPARRALHAAAPSPDPAPAPHGPPPPPPLPPPPLLAPITSFLTPLGRGHPPLSLHGRSRPPAPERAGGEVEEEVEGAREGGRGERGAGPAQRGERGGGGAEGARRSGIGDGAAAMERGGVRAREGEDGWSIWEDEDEVEEV
ncbi:hypothetical protein JCM9279_006294 [Rhodotorula babjevae]